jgi:hypothetical protein
VTIVVSLVKECNDIANYDIEEEIKKELSEHLSLIPWAEEIQSVTVE